MVRRKIIFAIGIAAVLLAAGAAGVMHLGKCIAGGGGYNFDPPEKIEADRELVLSLSLNSWGQTSCIRKKYWIEDRPRNLYSNMQCNFRPQGGDTYSSVPMTFISDEVGEAFYRAKYQCVIPPQKAGSILEYFFSYDWGDTPEKISPPAAPVE